MALKYAVANGNWSNTATWNGGTLPQAGDDVHANGFTVNIDQNITVSKISTEAASPAVLGGGFTASNGVVINANILNGPTTGACLTFSLSTPNAITINGNVSNVNGGANSGHTLNKTGTGTITINGDILPHLSIAGATSSPLNITASGTVNINGNVAGGNISAKHGISVNAAATLNIVGNITGSGASNVFAINLGANAAVLNIVGNITGGAGNAINGTSSAVLTVTGTVTAGATPAISFTGSGAIVTADGILVGLAGVLPIFCQRIYLGDNAVTWTFQKSTLVNKTLYSPEVLPGIPSVGNVRQGTVYGPSSELTGTLVVPSPSNVRKGVPTDNTIGTAELTAQDLFDAIAASSDPVAVRLRNVATVETTGDQIAAFNI